MSEKNVIAFTIQITGGSANGALVAPRAGPTGINTKDIVDAINEATNDFMGLTVPVTINLYPDTKKFEIIIELPSTSSLLLKEAGAEKGTSAAGTDIIGDISLDQTVKVARMKKDVLMAKTFKGMVKSILGTCLSVGITVEGQNPKEIQKMIDNGDFDDVMEEKE